MSKNIKIIQLPHLNEFINIITSRQHQFRLAGQTENTSGKN